MSEARDSDGSSTQDWYRALSRYEKPALAKAVAQLLNTLLPYGLLWVIMVWMLKAGLPYWALSPLLLLAAGFLVRIFIIFHDCCHGSFVKSKTANQLLGYVTGLLTFTPYEGWQHPHNRHHATTGDLDRRGTGDVWTLTVEEYQAAPWWRRMSYRFFRNPVQLFLVSPALLFFISHRFFRKGSGLRERRSVLLTNLGLLLILLIAQRTIGLGTYLLIQSPVMLVTASIGVWLFYVQHQYEAVYWARHQEWDPVRAALEGSSYYQMPRWLEWFTGSIGFHFLHHLRPRIPNYHLRRCCEEMPVEPAAEPLTLHGSLASLSLHLWSEADRKLVRFPGWRSSKRVRQ